MWFKSIITMSKPVVSQRRSFLMSHERWQWESGEIFLDCWAISFAYVLILGWIIVLSLEINDLQINELLLWERTWTKYLSLPNLCKNSLLNTWEAYTLTGYMWSEVDPNFWLCALYSSSSYIFISLLTRLRDNKLHLISLNWSDGHKGSAWAELPSVLTHLKWIYLVNPHCICSLRKKKLK